MQTATLQSQSFISLLFAFLKFSKYSTKKGGFYNARVVSRIVTRMVSMIVAKAIVSRVIDCGVISTIISRMVSRVVNGIYCGHKDGFYGGC